MKLRSLLSAILLITVTGLGLLQWQRQQDATRQIDWLFGTLRPVVVIRSEQMWAPLWGGLQFDDLYLTIGEQWRQQWRPPSGLYLRAEQVDVSELAWDAQGQIEALRIQMGSLRLPALNGWLGGRDWHLLGLPSIGLRSLGYEQLQGSLQLRAQRLADARSLQLDMQAAFDGFLNWDLQLDLDVDQRILQHWPEDAGLRSLKLRIVDQGLLQRYKQTLARDLRITPAAAERRIIEQLDRYVTDSGLRWEPQTQTAVRRWLRAGGELQLELLPLPDFELRNLRLYGAEHWPVLLGLSAQQQDPAQ